MFETRVVEKMKTHISWQIPLFFENRAAYEVMWKNMVQPDRSQMIRRRKDRFACEMTKANRDTLRMCNTECFSWQQWLGECESVLHYSTLPVLNFCHVVHWIS